MPEKESLDQCGTEKTEPKLGRRGKRNNYADNFYTPNTPDDSDIPAFKISPKIHKIKLSSISAGSLKQLSVLLEKNGFKKISDTIPEKGKYDRNRIFNDGTTKIKIFYNLPGSDFGGLPIFIEIIYPTKEIIYLFNSFFSRFSISPKFNQLEIAFDFLTDELTRLRHVLDKHLFLRYQRHPSFSVKTTFYSSDCRKTSKGTRTYGKKVDNQKVIRLELVLNRRALRQLRFDISWIPIDKIDFGKYFSFKVIDLDKITNYLIRLNKSEIKELEESDGMSGELLKRHIESWVRSRFIPRNPFKEKFMKHVEKLKEKEKKIPNYIRFLKDHILLNQKFRDALMDKTFLPIINKRIGTTEKE
jgi:hypothetical protein